MKDATPRMKALLAGGATVLVFGMIMPANADPDREPGRPGVGEVGMATEKANPPGQTWELDQDADSNRGFRCDGNHGVGDGNPAHGTCAATEGDGTNTGTVTKPGGKPDKGGTDGEWVPDGT